MRVGLVRSVAVGMVALVGLGLAGCDDTPTDIDTDQTVSIATNPSVMVIPAGITTLLQSRTENEGREPTWEDISATVDGTCGSAAVTVEVAASYEPAVQPPGVFDVTGGTTLGETCIELSGGGASATVEVTVVADSLEILNAPATIEPATGVTTAQLSAALLSDDGQAVSPFDPTTDLVWSSDDEAVLTVDQTGLVTATGPGAATVSATWSGGGASITESVTIEVLVPAPVLTSTDVNSAAPLETVTITGTGLIPGFHSVFIDGFAVGSDATYPAEIVNSTTATFVMSEGVEGNELAITIGVPGDVSDPPLTVTRTCGSFTDCPSEDDNNDPSTAPLVLVPFSATGIVEANDLDDFYRFDLAVETTLQMDLSWTGDSEDLDLLVVDAAFTAFQCGFVTATGSVPESGQCTLPAGSYAFWVNSFDEGFAVYDLQIQIVP